MTELDPTANRMHIEAAENSAATLQDIASEIAGDAVGEPVPAVAGELQEKWAERYGDAAAELPSDAAVEIAEHLSAGDDVTVLPPPIPTAESQ